MRVSIIKTITDKCTLQANNGKLSQHKDSDITNTRLPNINDLLGLSLPLCLSLSLYKYRKYRTPEASWTTGSSWSREIEELAERVRDKD